ncbi:cell division protein ZipA [Vibrio salinus]|uniref:cell division protein ZipA n=1 Tax=Vibrio salinus TaxID=2899784 RepID=UPI001E40E7F5|nr:cell division protein ZipA [Vibrio salinus]MCE0493004.1 cell division protein ZipA [Vibrio salinus]
MQELRFVLIVVGLLAIAALLFHGLWTSRKEGKSKFNDKPLGKMEKNASSEKTKQKKKRKEPGFSTEDSEVDPLIDSSFDNIDDPLVQSSDADYLTKTIDEVEHELDEQIRVSEPDVEDELPAFDASLPDDVSFPVGEQPAAKEVAPDEEFEVIVLNVHCAGTTPFVGTELFESMQNNGLLYGEMDIFHRHADLSGTGKVLFSVANIMQPGTLKHDDPAEFTTKGISFFMTLPCFGDPEQNFKLMLKTAQQIADDLGGNVLDEQRNLITPNKIDQYRKQIQQFKATKQNS